MRTAMFTLALVLIFAASPVFGSVVIHDGAPGIVACASYDYYYLDSNSTSGG